MQTCSEDSLVRDVVVQLQGVAKSYAVRIRPLRRMWQALRGLPPSVPGQAEAVFTALHPCDLVVRRGEVLGLVGKNGAGKSTLLQLISGTLAPSQGRMQVQGKVSAILELGAGFNTEFTGRENIHLALATAGMTPSQIHAQVQEIIDFSGVSPFIDQPIKTYSSGMQVRLAFSIATCARPDVLVIDEALSVGDGEFARKSFDRIMNLKAGGTTILFCSHSLFHIEALCSQVIWLEAGRIVAQGRPGKVLPFYQSFLDGASVDLAVVQPQLQPELALSSLPNPPLSIDACLTGHARMQSLRLMVRHGESESATGAGGTVHLLSGSASLLIQAEFLSDPAMSVPSFAVTLHSLDGRILGSAGAWNDQQLLQRDANGAGTVMVEFPTLGLLKGVYTVSAFLFCERGLHIYDNADHFARVEVAQAGLEQGLFHFPRRWRFATGLMHGNG